MIVPMFRRVIKRFTMNEKLTREEKHMCLCVIVLAFKEVYEVEQQYALLE